MIRSPLAFRFAFANFALTLACSGTETDNPVVASGDGGGDYVSPDATTRPRPVAPCPAPAEDELGPPAGLPHGALFQLPERGQFLAQGGDGLEMWDVNDPANPKRVSQGAVRGTIHQVLPAGATQLWVAATEPPIVDSRQLPSAEGLDPALRVVELDITDPAAPLRQTEATLSDDFWQMQERGNALWTLTGRRVSSLRGCSAPKDICRYQYEAVELHGLVRNGSALETVASAELPLGLRVWWATDGIATLTEDGTLHVLRWDDSGALRAPLEVPMPGGALDPDIGPGNGPLEIVGNQLLWVGTTAEGNTLYRFDLDVDVTQPTSVFDLGPSDVPWSGLSLFWQNRLWLNSPGDNGEAQLWDIGGATPERIALPQTFSRVLPLPGASLDGYSDVPLALGWTSSRLSQSFEVLTVNGSNVSVAKDLGRPEISPSTSMPAPPELHGTTVAAPAWNIVERGPGLPMGLDPSTVPDTTGPWTLDFVGIVSDSGELRAQATLIEEAANTPPRLEIDTGTGTVNLSVPDGSDRLVPVPNGVVVLVNETLEACTSSADCARGVTLVDISGSPRLAGSLPLPIPDVGLPWDPGHGMYLSWGGYDSVTGSSSPELLDAQHLVFVAAVSLLCDTQPRCDALGIQPIPSDPASGDLWGESYRQYVYTLQVAGKGAPRWQSVGVSGVQATVKGPNEMPSFAAPRALGGTMAVTRVERTSPAGDLLPSGQVRFVLDRFRLTGANKPEGASAVNIPGFPVAYLGPNTDAEYWVSAEPLTGATSQTRLHRLRITADGAENESQLDLDGAFSGFWPLQVDGEARGIAVSNPENACGVTHVSALGLGGPSAGGTLTLSSQLDLPENEWRVVTTDGPRVLLGRDGNYALLELDTSGTLQLVTLKSLPVSHGQLLGTTLRGIGGSEAVTIEF